jgi:ubiquinone biosynthesis accessory factor UbiJ
LLFQGNAQTLMTKNKVIRNFEFNWEGLLADHIGDLSAAALARRLRAQWSWGKELDNFVDEMERFGTLIDRAED